MWNKCCFQDMYEKKLETKERCKLHTVPVKKILHKRRSKLMLRYVISK